MANVTPPWATYNSDKPITQLELSRAVRDMRFGHVFLIDRSNIAPGALSLMWSGMEVQVHTIYCRDKAEADAIIGRMREAGFKGDIKGEWEAFAFGLRACFDGVVYYGNRSPVQVDEGNASLDAHGIKRTPPPLSRPSPWNVPVSN